MSLTEVVMFEGVGTAKFAAKICPVTCGELEKTLVESAVSEKPVMKLAAAGLTPMLPVMAEVGTVEMAVFARMTKLPAMPRFTAATGATTLPVVKVELKFAASAAPAALCAPTVICTV